MSDPPGNDRIEPVLRSTILRKYGLRRDVISETLLKTGWSHCVKIPVEVLLRFKGTSGDVPALRGVLVSANAKEWVITDTLGRYWAASKGTWDVDPVVVRMDRVD